MTESQAEYKPEETADSSPEVAPQNTEYKAEPRPAQRTSRTGTVVLWLAVIGLGGALGAFYWQQQQQGQSQRDALAQMESSYQALRQELENEQAGLRTELQSQIALLESSAGLLESAMNELQQTEQQDAQQMLELRQGMERQLQDTRTTVAALQRQLVGLQQRDNRWLNAEAAYLMRLANYKVTVEHDVQTAVQMLQTIERLLADQLDTAARSALSSVTADRASLQSVNMPDKLSLSARIDELLQKLDAISITASREQSYQQGIQGSQTSVVAQERGWVAALTDLLRSIFVWRKVDTSVSDYLPPDEETLVKEQIRLQFEQARTAVIQASQSLFEHALLQVEAGLQRYFVQDSEQARQLLTEVQQLRAQRIVPRLPDLSGSLVLIEQLQNPLILPEETPAAPVEVEQ